MEVGRRSCVGRREAWRKGGRGLLCLVCTVFISSYSLRIFSALEVGRVGNGEGEGERREMGKVEGRVSGLGGGNTSSWHRAAPSWV